MHAGKMHNSAAQRWPAAFFLDIQRTHAHTSSHMLRVIHPAEISHFTSHTRTRRLFGFFTRKHLFSFDGGVFTFTQLTASVFSLKFHLHKTAETIHVISDVCEHKLNVF